MRCSQESDSACRAPAAEDGGAAFTDLRGDLVGADLSTLLKVALSVSKGESRAGGGGQVVGSLSRDSLAGRRRSGVTGRRHGASRKHDVVTKRARRGRLLGVVGHEPAKTQFAHGRQMQAVKGSTVPFA